MTPVDTFGALLRHLREGAALTQEELAERAGLTAKGISALERGDRRRPHPQTVRALAGALGLSDEDRRVFVEVATGRRAPPAGSAPNVPVPTTSLVGREREVETVRELLGRARMVTLTGPGGVGKSRLALEAAGRMAEASADAITFVSLAPLSDPSQVVPAIAKALGMRQANLTRPLAHALHAYLRPRAMLLVLDNFEHLAGASSEIAELLSACPDLRLLVTSRSPLRIRGEHQLGVMPLATPPLHQERLDQVEQAAAVQLFVQRAAQSDPDFALTPDNAGTVAEICRRLDGLPLAIELAAARVRLLGADALLARLEPVLPVLDGGGPDLPERQQALRRTVAWSCDLLSQDQRRVFRRLSIFAGGWSIDAASAVCGTDDITMLDHLSSLLDESLIVRRPLEPRTPPRFNMLATIRAYGLEELAGSGELEELQVRHARYYTSLAREAATQLRGPAQVRWLERLTLEQDNVLSALRVLTDRGEHEAAVDMAWDLWVFWYVRNLSEGHWWLDAALRPDAELSTAARARALFIASSLLYPRREDRARNLLDMSIEEAERAGEPETLAVALLVRGLVAVFQDHHERAESWIDRSLAICRERGDHWTTAFGLRGKAYLALERRDVAAARAPMDEGEALARELDSAWSLGVALGLQGLVAAMEDRRDAAISGLRESIALLWQVRDDWTLSHSLAGMAGEMAGTDPQRAAFLFGAAEELRARTGAELHHWHRPLYRRRLTRVRSMLAPAGFDACWEEGRATPLERVVALVAE
jgi:predicted ATPase/DNA-binding XRE family transcriptional regulator